jgi:hypothetical protein
VYRPRSHDRHDRTVRRSCAAELTTSQQQLILQGLFELTLRHPEDDVLRRDARALAAKLGGRPDAMFFGAIPTLD